MSFCICCYCFYFCSPIPSVHHSKVVMRMRRENPHEMGGSARKRANMDISRYFRAWVGTTETGFKCGAWILAGPAHRPVPVKVDHPPSFLPGWRWPIDNIFLCYPFNWYLSHPFIENPTYFTQLGVPLRMPSLSLWMYTFLSGLPIHSMDTPVSFINSSWVCLPNPLLGALPEKKKKDEVCEDLLTKILRGVSQFYLWIRRLHYKIPTIYATVLSV